MALNPGPIAASSRSARISRPTSTSPSTLARERGLELALVDHAEIASHLDDRVAILMLTHVNYRTGRMHADGELTRAAHDAGAIVVWDLAHSAGAVPVDLHGAGADIAVGCGYKYLNGGPGAPAFIWAIRATRNDSIARAGASRCQAGSVTPQPFAFAPHYQPAHGIRRFICGTPPVLSLAALECGVDSVLAADAIGGIARDPPQVDRADRPLHRAG